MSSRTVSALSVLLAVLATALAAGCVGIPATSAQRAMRAADQLQLEKTVASARVAQDSWPAKDWWTAFADPQLNDLEREALAANPTLQVAKARVEHARAVAGSSRSALLP